MLNTVSVLGNSMDDGNQARERQGRKRCRSNVMQMRFVKFGLESRNRAGQPKKRDDAPIYNLEIPMAEEGVVDERDVGAEKQEDDALKVELEEVGEDPSTVRHEGVESRCLLNEGGYWPRPRSRGGSGVDGKDGRLVRLDVLTWRKTGNREKCRKTK
jgi:hypothetical protein